MKAKSVIQGVLVGASVLFLSELSDIAPVSAYKQAQSEVVTQVQEGQSLSVAQVPMEQLLAEVSSSSNSAEGVVRLAILTVFGVTVIKALKS